MPSLPADPATGENPLPLLRSPVIPDRFRHGFTMRQGGVSGPPFAQLNLGARWGDAPENVRENRRRVRAASGAARFFYATQVHGASAINVGADDAVAEIARREADALFSAQPDLAVAVFVADCIPVLMADERTGAFAAVHAGWRGTVAGVLPETVRRMSADLGTRPQDLRVAMGPAIGPCCFEVGDEVVAAVERAVPGARREGAIRHEAGWAKAHVDLKRVNVLLLREAGVAAGAIDASPECTSCDAGRFYSYRRDKGVTGQHLAFIARLSARLLATGAP